MGQVGTDNSKKNTEPLQMVVWTKIKFLVAEISRRGPGLGTCIRECQGVKWPCSFFFEQRNKISCERLGGRDAPGYRKRKGGGKPQGQEEAAGGASLQLPHLHPPAGFGMLYIS